MCSFFYVLPQNITSNRHNNWLWNNETMGTFQLLFFPRICHIFNFPATFPYYWNIIIFTLWFEKLQNKWWKWIFSYFLIFIHFLAISWIEMREKYDFSKKSTFIHSQLHIYPTSYSWKTYFIFLNGWKHPPSYGRTAESLTLIQNAWITKWLKSSNGFKCFASSFSVFVMVAAICCVSRKIL